MKKDNCKVEYRPTIGHTADGKAIRKSFYGKSLKQAKEKAAQYKIQMALSADEEDAAYKFPLFKEIAEKYLAQKTKNVRKNSAYHYQSISKLYLDKLGNRRINRIRKSDIQKLLDELGEEYSQNYLRDVNTQIASVFQYAVENDIITSSPCKGIKYNSAKSASEKSVYTEEETALILDYAYTRVDGVAVDLMLSYGTTISETLGIQYGDVDFDNKTISIIRSVTLTQGKVNVDEPKNKHRKRVIAVSDMTLEHIRKACSEEYTYLIHEESRVLPCNPQRFRRMYNKFMMAMQNHYEDIDIDIPILNPHELRHTRATIWVNKDINLFAIAEEMGWSDLQMLRKVYGHPDMNKLRKSLGI